MDAVKSPVGFWKSEVGGSGLHHVCSDDQTYLPATKNIEVCRPVCIMTQLSKLAADDLLGL